MSADSSQHPNDFLEIERFGIKGVSDPFDILLVHFMFRISDSLEHVSVSPDAAFVRLASRLDRRRLLTRCVVRKRPPPHSGRRKWAGLGVQEQAIVVSWSFGCEIGPKSGRIVTLESANGKSPLERGHARWLKISWLTH